MKIKTLLITSLAALTTIAAAQTLTDEAKKNVLDAITTNVKERAYVGGVDFSKWDKFVAEHQAEFNKAETNDSFALAVNQALDEFGFSHIQLLTPRAAETRTTGKSVGIGVLIEPAPNGIRITRVIPGGPAEKAGLKVGDVIIRADGVKVTGPDRVRGAKGTKVVITVLRNDTEEINVAIIRGEFSLLVKDELKWLDDKTVMLRINSFATGYETKQINLFFEEAAKADRMIIDLRSNGGGAVPNLMHLGGKVLARDASMGKFITRADAREYIKKHPDSSDDPVKVATEFGLELQGYGSKGVKPFAGDLVVLLNGGSASASEIFAASVKDNHRGKIVGSKSAGAVLASTFMRLPEGFSLQIPLMEYVTPGGKRLEGSGVIPDVTLAPGKVNDDDAVIVAAKEALDAIKKEAAAQKPPPGK